MNHPLRPGFKLVDEEYRTQHWFTADIVLGIAFTIMLVLVLLLAFALAGQSDSSALAR